MMRAEIVDPRAIDFDVSDLPDLSGTPWQRIWLSSREPIWTLVDAVDYAWLSANVWNVSWGSRTPWQKYAKRNVGRARDTLRMHREVQMLADPRDEMFMATHHVDHGNGQTLDNRRDNLSWATNAENSANRRPRGNIPTLDAIVRDLLAGLPAQQFEEMPF